MSLCEATPCLICRRPALFRDRGPIRDMVTGDPYAVVECSNCRVLRTLPVPEDLAAHYVSELGQLMKSRGSRLHAALKAWWVACELRRMTDQLEGAVAVDVGCGAGEISVVLQRQGRTVMAADAEAVPPPALRGLDRLTYYPMAFDTYELRGFRPSGQPLAVIVRHVLEHLKDPAAFLHRMQAYGARSFYLVVPNAACLERQVFGRSWNLWDPPRHLWHFNAGALRLLVEAAGLRVVTMGHDTIPNVIPSLYRSLRLRGVPARRLEWMNPKSLFSTLCAPLNLFFPGNVVWCVASLPLDAA